MFGQPEPSDPPATEAADTMFRNRHGGDPELYGSMAPSNEMFPIEKALEQTFRRREGDVADVLGLSESQRQARHREFAQVIRQSGLDPYTVGAKLYDEWTTAQLAEVRGDDIDPGQTQAGVFEMRRQLREDGTLGGGRQESGKDAEQLFAAEADYLRQHPRLRRILATRDLGMQPDIRRLILEHVRRRRFAT